MATNLNQNRRSAPGSGCVDFDVLQKMDPVTRPNEDLSKAFLIALDVKSPPREKRDARILQETSVDQEGLEVIDRAVKALTALAIDQIHRSFRGNPPITRDEALRNIRDAAFFLTDEAFERLLKFADWCVAKGA